LKLLALSGACQQSAGPCQQGISNKFARDALDPRPPAPRSADAPRRLLHSLRSDARAGSAERPWLAARTQVRWLSHGAPRLCSRPAVVADGELAIERAPSKTAGRRSPGRCSPRCQKRMANPPCSIATLRLIGLSVLMTPFGLSVGIPL
jgi:hypothetical protein